MVTLFLMQNVREWKDLLAVGRARRHRVIESHIVERQRHGVVQLKRPIVYEGGQDYTPPHRAIDILESLLNRKAITKDEQIAGDRFRDWFRLAQLEQLRAADMARPFVDGGGGTPDLTQNDTARKEIAKAIRWVGGIGSSGGSCLWHVVGLDQSLRKWCQEQAKSSVIGRVLNHNGAAGVLVVALESLARMSWSGPGE